MPIVTCNSCGYVFQLYRFSSKFYEDFYSKYYREKIFQNLKPSTKFINDQKYRGKKLYNFLKKKKLSRIMEVCLMLVVHLGYSYFLLLKMVECFGNDPDKAFVDYGLKIQSPNKI